MTTYQLRGSGKHHLTKLSTTFVLGKESAPALLRAVGRSLVESGEPLTKRLATAYGLSENLLHSLRGFPELFYNVDGEPLHYRETPGDRLRADVSERSSVTILPGEGRILGANIIQRQLTFRDLPSVRGVLAHYAHGEQRGVSLAAELLENNPVSLRFEPVDLLVYGVERTNNTGPCDYRNVIRSFHHLGNTAIMVEGWERQPDDNHHLKGFYFRSRGGIEVMTGELEAGLYPSSVSNAPTRALLTPRIPEIVQ